MKKFKYGVYDYWLEKRSKGERFWHGLFEKRPIQKESVIIHSVMQQKEENKQKDGWAVYPDAYSVIGFLQYIYFPTVLTTFLQEAIPESICSKEEIDIIFDNYSMDDPDPEKEDIFLLLDDFYVQLMILMNVKESAVLDELIRWNKRFQEEIRTINSDIEISFQLFRSPEEAIQHVVAAYEVEAGIEQLEKEMGFTKEQLLEIADAYVYDNQFMQRKFISLLDGRVTVPS